MGILKRQKHKCMKKNNLQGPQISGKIKKVTILVSVPKNRKILICLQSRTFFCIYLPFCPLMLDLVGNAVGYEFC